MHIMEVGSIQQGKGRFENIMDSSKNTWFPNFYCNRSSLEQSAKRESDFIANYHNLANTITVFTAVTIHSANTIVSIKNSEPFIRFKQRKASLDRAGKLITPNVDSLREILHAEAISEDSAAIIANARRSVQMLITNQPDVSGIAGVLKGKLLPIKCSVNTILQFLTE